MAPFRSSLAILVTLLFLFAGLQFGSRPRAAEPLPLGDAVYIETPPFVVTGTRYAFTWAGGGPAQTYMVKAVRHDGWALVDVADETINPINYVAEVPTRWLHIGLAISIQEMRPHQ